MLNASKVNQITARKSLPATCAKVIHEVESFFENYSASSEPISGIIITDVPNDTTQYLINFFEAWDFNIKSASSNRLFITWGSIGTKKLEVPFS